MLPPITSKVVIGPCCPVNPASSAPGPWCPANPASSTNPGLIMNNSHTVVGETVAGSDCGLLLGPLCVGMAGRGRCAGGWKDQQCHCRGPAAIVFACPASLVCLGMGVWSILTVARGVYHPSTHARIANGCACGWLITAAHVPVLVRMCVVQWVYMWLWVTGKVTVVGNRQGQGCG